MDPDGVIESNWEEVVDNFDDMNLKEELLRGKDRISCTIVFCLLTMSFIYINYYFVQIEPVRITNSFLKHNFNLVTKLSNV